MRVRRAARARLARSQADDGLGAGKPQRRMKVWTSDRMALFDKALVAHRPKPKPQSAGPPKPKPQSAGPPKATVLATTRLWGRMAQADGAPRPTRLQSVGRRLPQPPRAPPSLIHTFPRLASPPVRRPTSRLPSPLGHAAGAHSHLLSSHLSPLIHTSPLGHAAGARADGHADGHPGAYGAARARGGGGRGRRVHS